MYSQNGCGFYTKCVYVYSIKFVYFDTPGSLFSRRITNFSTINRLSARAIIESQPIPPTVRLARDTNILMVWVELKKHYTPNQHDSNYRLPSNDAFPHSAIKSEKVNNSFFITSIIKQFSRVSLCKYFLFKLEIKF